MDVHHTFVSMNQEFSYSLKRESATDAILKIHYSSAICRNDSKLAMRAGETSDFKPSELHFPTLLMAEKNNVGQTFLNNIRILQP
jgi:hypothetical protein